MDPIAPQSKSPALWHAAQEERAAHVAAATGAYHSLLQFHARTSRLRSGTLMELGLTHARLRIIGVIAGAPDLSISQIARQLDLSRQAVHRVLHEMAKADVVILSTARHDRRLRTVRLATLGRFLAELALPWEREWTSLILRNANTSNLRGIDTLSNYVRGNLPWTIRGPDDSARFFERPDPPRPRLRL